jgi:hypothetical protein
MTARSHIIVKLTGLAVKAYQTKLISKTTHDLGEVFALTHSVRGLQFFCIADLCYWTIAKRRAESFMLQGGKQIRGVNEQKSAF